MGIDFTGTTDHVAGMMQEIMEEVGGDGFLFFNTYFDRRYIMEVCDGLVPELQRRGLTRTRVYTQAFQGQSAGVLALLSLRAQRSNLDGIASLRSQ